MMSYGIMRIVLTVSRGGEAEGSWKYIRGGSHT